MIRRLTDFKKRLTSSFAGTVAGKGGREVKVGGRCEARWRREQRYPESANIQLPHFDHSAIKLN